RAGAQGPVFRGRHQPAAVVGQVLLVQLTLGNVPLLVPVQGRHAQREPLHRTHAGEDAGQVAAIAGADHGDGVTVDGRMAVQQVVGGQQVLEVVLAGNL